MKISELKELLKSAPNYTEIKITYDDTASSEQKEADLGELEKECLSETTIIELQPQDVTKRIKTFDDAYDWCEENGYSKLTSEYEGVVRMNQDMSYDVVAYMKLRIITCALNEGWEPKAGYARWTPKWLINDGHCCHYYNKEQDYVFGDSSCALSFKTKELAEYAAKQFKDIYADFCGTKK